MEVDATERRSRFLKAMTAYLGWMRNHSTRFLFLYTKLKLSFLLTYSLQDTNLEHLLSLVTYHALSKTAVRGHSGEFLVFVHTELLWFGKLLPLQTEVKIINAHNLLADLRKNVPVMLFTYRSENPFTLLHKFPHAYSVNIKGKWFITPSV